MRAAKLWPLGVAGVLAITVAANVLLYWAANDRSAATVEPDYYRKALAWDSTLAQERRDVALGWTLAAELGPPAPDGRAVLRVRLTDRRGHPIVGARVTVAALHNLDAARVVTAEVVPAPGGYAARLPLDHRGQWELRFTAQRGRERFTTTLRRDAPGARP